MKGHNYGLCRKCGKIHESPFKGHTIGGICKKCGKIHLVKHPMEGKHLTPETKRKISVANIGHKTWSMGLTKETDERLRQISLKSGKYERTEEWKVAVSERMKNWHKNNIHPRQGKHLSDKLKKRISRKVTETLKDETIRAKCREGRLKQILPKNGTYIENTMKNELIKRGINYEKQVTLLGKYKVDFLIRNLIVECDGAYWHNYPYGLEKDHRRDKELEEQGFIVSRFWGKDIRNNISECVDKIEELLVCECV